MKFDIRNVPLGPQKQNVGSIIEIKLKRLQIYSPLDYNHVIRIKGTQKQLITLGPVN